MNLQVFSPNNETTAQVAAHVQEVLSLVGENPYRQGLVRTPERVGEAFQFLTKGYQEDPRRSSVRRCSRRTTARW